MGKSSMLLGQRGPGEEVAKACFTMAGMALVTFVAFCVALKRLDMMKEWIEMKNRLS